MRRAGPRARHLEGSGRKGGLWVPQFPRPRRPDGSPPCPGRRWRVEVGGAATGGGSRGGARRRPLRRKGRVAPPSRSAAAPPQAAREDDFCRQDSLGETQRSVDPGGARPMGRGRGPGAPPSRGKGHLWPRRPRSGGSKKGPGRPPVQGKGRVTPPSAHSAFWAQRPTARPPKKRAGSPPVQKRAGSPPCPGRAAALGTGADFRPPRKKEPGHPPVQLPPPPPLPSPPPLRAGAGAASRPEKFFWRWAAWFSALGALPDGVGDGVGRVLRVADGGGWRWMASGSPRDGVQW